MVRPVYGNFPTVGDAKREVERLPAEIQGKTVGQKDAASASGHEIINTDSVRC